MMMSSGFLMPYHTHKFRLSLFAADIFFQWSHLKIQYSSYKTHILPQNVYNFVFMVLDFQCNIAIATAAYQPRNIFGSILIRVAMHNAYVKFAILTCV